MKYGLIVFGESRNIGDDIQTYAVERFLPRIDYYLDREELDEFIPDGDEHVAAIFAGWFLQNHLNWPPAPFIKPLLISMHFDTYMSKFARETIEKNYVLDGYGGEWLRKNGPVGSRDQFTELLLGQHEIPAYFSGCITLTLNKFNDVIYNGKICLVDVPERTKEYIKSKEPGNIAVYSHEKEINDFGWDIKRRDVIERLKIYQGAKCVITTRLHAALPCLALGTPVVLIDDAVGYTRMGTWYLYVNHVSEYGILNGELDTYLCNPKENPDGFLPLREELEKRCKDFISECEREDINKDGMLQYDAFTYRESIQRIKRLKKLMEQRIDKYERRIKGD